MVKFFIKNNYTYIKYNYLFNTFVQYIKEHKSSNNDIYLSISLLSDKFCLSEKETINILEFFYKNSPFIYKSYSIYCPENNNEFCDAVL